MIIMDMLMIILVIILHDSPMADSASMMMCIILLMHTDSKSPVLSVRELIMVSESQALVIIVELFQ